MGYPSVFPTGTILYDKEKAWNGYTIFPSGRGALLLDMNGNEVQRWAGLGGFPNRFFPEDMLWEPQEHVPENMLIRTR